MADRESMLFSQVSVQSLRRRKRTSSAALLPTWEEPLVGDHVFPHGLQHFETLLTHRTRQLFRSRRRPMISPKMSPQGLFGCVTPATLNTMKLHLLPMTLKMEVRHTLEAKTLPQSSQEYPVSPEWALIYFLKDLVLAKLWQHNSQEVSPG